MFIEEWEYYKYGSKKARFVQLIYVPNREQELIKGHLPQTHGMSYFYCREYFKQLGDKMGLDLLAERPDLDYSDLVELTKNMED